MHAAGPQGLTVEQHGQQVDEVARRDRRQGGAVLDQPGQKRGGALAVGAVPDAGSAQRLQRQGQAARRLLDPRLAVGEGQGEDVERAQQVLGKDGHLWGLEAGKKAVAITGPWPPQGGPFQQGRPPAQVLRHAIQGRQRMLEDGQHQDRRQGIHRPVSDKPRQHGDRESGQRRAGRGVGDDAEPRQPGADPSRQGQVRGDKGAGPLRILQRLAQQQGADVGGLLLVPRRDHRQPGKALGQRVDPVGGALPAQILEHRAPVGRGLGRSQRLVDHPAAPAPPTVGVGQPGGDPAATDAGVDVQQPLHRALRMLVLDLEPGGVGQPFIEAWENNGPAGGGGDGDQKPRGGRRRTGRARGDQRVAGRMADPLLGEGVEQPHPALGDIDQAALRQPGGPGLEGDAQEFGRAAPVGGHVQLDQAVEPVEGASDLLDLQVVEEAGQGVGHLQRPGGVEASTQTGVAGDQTGQLEAAGARVDGRRDVQRQVARLERRLALIQVADGADLRQQGRPAADRADEGLGQHAGPAPGRHEHDRFGQRLRVGQGGDQSGRQIVEKGPVGRDREPAGRRLLERAGHPAANRASAASRASGSPTCIQSPLGATP